MSTLEEVAARLGAMPSPSAHLRENIERLVTVTQGTNTIVGCDPEGIVTETLVTPDGKVKAGRVPELWDGQVARRIVEFTREREVRE